MRTDLLATLYTVAALGAATLAQNVCAKNPHGTHINIGDPTDCSAFTMCLGANATPMRCAPNMHFSHMLGDCDLEERANCSVDVVQPDPEGPVDPNNPCSRNVNFELIASMTDCNEYTICACGTPHLQRCADNLIFDARTQRCTSSSQALCLTASSVRPTCPRNAGNVGHPNDCKHFFLCLGQGEQPILRRCQPRLNYNRRVNQCDFVDCTVPALVSRLDGILTVPAVEDVAKIALK